MFKILLIGILFATLISYFLWNPEVNKKLENPQVLNDVKNILPQPPKPSPNDAIVLLFYD